MSPHIRGTPRGVLQSTLGSGCPRRLPIAKTTSRIWEGRGAPLQLQWHKCAGAEWCSLADVDLAEVDHVGVFVVWQPGDSGRAPAVLYVGRGTLRHAIADCRRDPVIGAKPDLRVTWAAVGPRDVDGVAAYLYQQLRPLWGEVPGSGPAQPVNLPLRS
jgi:hypothetical protein